MSDPVPALHVVGFDELWRNGRRAHLTPSPGELRARLADVLSDYWDDRLDGFEERAQALADDYRTALAIGPEDQRDEINAFIGGVLTVSGLAAKDRGAEDLAHARFAESLEVGRAWLSPALYSLALLHTGRAAEAEGTLRDAGAPTVPEEAYALGLAVRERDPAAALETVTTACESWRDDVKLARLRVDLSVATDRDTRAARIHLGHALYASGRLEDAIAVLTEAGPADADAFIELGEAHARLGQWSPAAAAFAQAAEHGTDPELHLAAAELYARAGEFEAGAAHVHEGLVAADHSRRFGAAQIYLALGRPDQALPLIRELRQAVPDDPRMLVLEGIALFAAGEHAAADALRAAREALPDEPVIGRHLAVALYDLGDLEAARSLLDEMLALAPDDSWLLAVRGDLRLRRHDRDGARVDLEAAVGAGFRSTWALTALAESIAISDPDRALDLLREAIEDGRPRAAPHAAMGRILWRMGRLQEAAEAFDRAFELDNSEPAALTRVIVEEIDVMSDETVVEAKEVAADALHRHPDHIPLRAAYCLLLDRLGETDAARAERERLVAAEPYEPEDYSAQGLTLSALERPEEAVAAFRNGLSVDPGNAELRYYLGRELHVLQRWDEAERELLAALEKMPDVGDFAVALGRLYLARSDFAAAEPHLRKAVELMPDDPYCRVDLADLLRLTERAEEGLRFANEAISRHEDGVTVGTRGQIRYLLERTLEARLDLERAIGMDATLTWARAVLADLYLRLGEVDKALEQADVVLGDSPADYPWILGVRGGAHFARGDYEAAERDLRAAPEDDLPAMRTLLDTLDRLGRQEEAVEILRERATSNGYLRMDQEPEVIVLYAEALQKAGKVDGARETLKLAAELWPGEARVPNALGWLEAATGRYEDARAAHQEAVDRSPDDPYLLADLAWSLRVNQRFGAAVDTVNRAIERLPHMGNAWATLCGCLSVMGVWDAARDAGLAATAEGNSHTWYCFDALGWVYLYQSGQSDLAAAMAMYERGLTLDAEQYWLLKGRAEVLFRRGDPAATTAFEEVISKLNPASADDLRVTAWCLYRLGRYAESLDCHQKAVAISPVPPDYVAYDLGLLAYADGDGEAARAAYAKAIEELAARPAERRPGLLDVAIRDLEVDQRGDPEVRRDLLALLREERARLALPKVPMPRFPPDEDHR